MAYNVLSVSEVPRKGIWAKVHSTVARYALLYEVRIKTANKLTVCCIRFQ